MRSVFPLLHCFLNFLIDEFIDDWNIFLLTSLNLVDHHLPVLRKTLLNAQLWVPLHKLDHFYDFLVFHHSFWDHLLIQIKYFNYFYYKLIWYLEDWSILLVIFVNYLELS